MIRSEDAVAPVVGVLLIIAVAVTIMAAVNVTLVPAMKESAEMDHLGRVEGAFVRFSADITTAAAMKQPLTLSEGLSLGGGETMLNRVRSAGTLHVRNENGPVAAIAVFSEGDPTASAVTLINISYHPIGNFWVDQGYRWEYGIVNLTKGTIETPLLYPTFNEASEYIRHTSGFPGSLITVTVHGGLMPERDAGGNLTGNLADNCTRIVVERVSYRAGSPAFASGNGNAVLTLSARVSEILIEDATAIQVTMGDAPYFFRESLEAEMNESFAGIAGRFSGIVFDDEEMILDLSDVKPQVVLREVDVTVTTG